MQDQDNIQVVVMIAEHLSMRPLILQRRLISAGVCVYIYIYIYKVFILVLLEKRIDFKVRSEIMGMNC